MMQDKKFPTGRALLVLTLFFFGGMMLTILASSLLPHFGLVKLPVLRATIILQNLITFIAPAVGVALIFGGGKPMTFLSAAKAPKLRDVCLMVLLYVCAIPAVNYLVTLNEAVVLPESMAAIEKALKESEDAARQVTEQLLGDKSMPGFAVTIFAVAILTGIGEEFFFRGALQGIFGKAIRNPHIVVWTVAFIFSAFHFQFYGLIPRTVLGAIFGYSVMWSRSLWVPILCHAVNNGTTAIWGETDASSIGGDISSPWLPIASAVATIGIMIWWNRMAKREVREQRLEN